MKVLYLNCSMGAAGDMLAAALYELLDDDGKKSFLERMNSLGLHGVSVCAEPSVKCGITGTHMNVAVNGVEEDEVIHDHHDHGHEHSHEHHHSHSSLGDIKHIIGHLPVSENVRSGALSVYSLIAEAESHVHGKPVTDIHFHEVGTADAVADVTAVCLLVEMLGAEKVYASPVHVGSGQVRCAHGILPVPAPATARILRDVPVYGGKINGELCTPTGAALLKHFVSQFGDMPLMRIEKTGYGMGKKDFEAANCVTAYLGEVSEEAGDTVCELCCNLDDMTPERISFAMQALLDAGALDVYTVAAGMKKARPGVVFCVMCRPSQKDEMVRLIFRHTDTIGIRENVMKRYVLSRSTQEKETPWGKIRIKTSEGYGVSRSKAEYEDLAKIAREQGISIGEVMKKAGL